MRKKLPKIELKNKSVKLFVIGLYDRVRVESVSVRAATSCGAVLPLPVQVSQLQHFSRIFLTNFRGFLNDFFRGFLNDIRGPSGGYRIDQIHN